MKTRSTVDGNLAFYLHYARAMCVYDAFSNSSTENRASSRTPNITCGLWPMIYRTVSNGTYNYY